MWRLIEKYYSSLVMEKNKPTTYCGKTRDEMLCLIAKLRELQDDGILTNGEKEAVTIAIEAMTDILEGMAK